MKLRIAKTAGFCMGVDRALRKLDQAIRTHGHQGTIYTLGPIIHNPQVLQKYAQLGVEQASSDTIFTPSDMVIIRAHGIPKNIEEKIAEQGVTLLDATCPKVKKAQVLIRQQADQGKHLLLFGEQEHPEVQGLVSYARDFTVFESEEELRSLTLSLHKTYFLAAQTTQDREAFVSIATYLSHAIQTEIHVLDTICLATKERQDEVQALSQQVDAMIIAGGKNSGNTRRLFQIAQEAGIYAVHVETASELPWEDLAQFEHIGLTAGASTPSWIIEEIIQSIGEVLRIKA